MSWLLDAVDAIRLSHDSDAESSVPVREHGNISNIELRPISIGMLPRRAGGGGGCCIEELNDRAVSFKSMYCRSLEHRDVVNKAFDASCL